MKEARTISNRELFSIVRDTLLEGKTVRVAVKGESSVLNFFEHVERVAHDGVRP